MIDKIICFGKNYSDHMHELGDQPVAKPVIFLKPASTILQCNKWNTQITSMLFNEDVNYECELVFKLKAGGFNIDPLKAQDLIESYTIGLDMTLRTQQSKLKKLGHPWTISKVFPDATILGPWIAFDNFDMLNYEFSLSINEEIKQTSIGSNMLFKPHELLSYASQHFVLCEKDIIFTGTPSGVGTIKANDIGHLKLNNNQFSIKWL